MGSATANHARDQAGHRDGAATMRAVGFHRYGPADVLEPLVVPRPRADPDGVVVRVAAAGVNPADTYLRAGRFRFLRRLRLPFVPGSDVAGTVVEVGPGVGGVRVGDRVFAMLPAFVGGGYAEYAAVPERDLAPIPGGLDLHEAAGVPLAALTALQALRDRARVQPATRVLVNGASGGVGSFAVQIAAALGARVTGVCSGRNADLVRDLGADDVRDYTLESAIPDDPVDVVFDAADTGAFRSWRPALRPGGVLVTVDIGKGNPVARLVARATGGGRRLTSLLVQPSGEDLATVAAWIDDGRVRPVVERTYPLEQAADAHLASETRRTRGKLVLTVGA